MIKDPSGKWRVLEDNPGFIGGPGDIRLAQEQLLKAFPEVEEKLALRLSDQFYEKLVKSYVEQAKKFNGGGRVIMYMVPPYPDNEDSRIRRILKDYGIETVTPNSDLQMKVMADGVYSFRKSLGPTSLEKVGYVVMNGEHKWMDAGHAVQLEKNATNDALNHITNRKTPADLREKLKAAVAQRPVNVPLMMKLLDSNPFLSNSARSEARNTKMADGLTDAILAEKVGSNYTPGVDFIGDKEFYFYVEKIIKYYLNEEPIIRNIETMRMSEINRSKIYQDISKYVVKMVDGRGGDGIWVGPKIKSQAEINEMIKRVEAQPENFIVQAYRPLSRLDNMIVDLRVVSIVHPDWIFVSDVPWARGIPADGNGKVNLSDLGVEVVPLVVDGLGDQCRHVFRPMRKYQRK
jgi:hypothetical protein